jgi:hypothetical protein
MSMALCSTTQLLASADELVLHVCPNSQCVSSHAVCHRVTGYRMLTGSEQDDFQQSWFRQTAADRVVEVLRATYGVRVLLSETGLPLEDMFRPEAKFHHQFDRELYRCGFYIMQTLWQQLRRYAYDGDGTDASYYRHPSWFPGVSSTIRSSVVFANKNTSFFMTSFLLGVDGLQHKVFDVLALVESLRAFILHKQPISKNGAVWGAFGWSRFELDLPQRLYVACIVGKIVCDNLGQLRTR